MKFKKMLAVCLAFVIAFSVITVSALSVSASESDFQYTVDESGAYATLTGYTGAGGNVVIPSEIGGYPVRFIGQYAFLENDAITAVEIPSSVKAVDQYAFFRCENLAAVTFNEGIKYIGTAAFNSCTSLASVTLPDTVVYVDDYAFYNCTSAANISLGKRVSYIGEYALGMYTTTTKSGMDYETYWTLYDKSNSIVKNVSMSGYSSTAAPSYVSENGFKNNYTDLGAADVNDIGDVNGDGDINIKDATVTQKISVGILSASNYDLFVCDVDDDNAVTGGDTTAIQKYIVGYDVVLGGDDYEIPYGGDDPAQYTGLPVLKFYDITDSDKANDYTIGQIISYGSKDYTSTARVVIEGLFDQTVESYVNMKLQGSSSLSYNKKNFTVKFYKDAAESSKNKMVVSDGWGKEYKYCLKANYIDHSHARNIVSAKLWGDIVRSRDNVNENLADLVNCGAIDGFPVMLYINDQYQGLYTFNIPKDDWMFGMDSKDVNEAILCGEQHSGAAAFLNTFDSTWSIEYATDEDNTQWIEDTFNEFYYFVNNSTDEEFKAGLSEYTDVEGCIDYLLFIQAICGMDDLDKNMLLVTFDGGDHWIPSVYDLDTTFGIYWTGDSFFADNEMLDISTRSPSKLWERLLKNYDAEIKARYAQLRQGALSMENIITRFEDFASVIPSGLYALDSNRTNINGNSYTIPQNDCSNINQIVTYMSYRFDYLDEYWGYAG